MANGVCLLSVIFLPHKRRTARQRQTLERAPTRGSPLTIPLHPVYRGAFRIMQANSDQGDSSGSQSSKKLLPINHLLFADDTMFFGKFNAAGCATLLSILDRYEMASRQCINRGKSAITFSSKTSQECKTRVKAVLNISNEGGIGKYLGLPEYFGKKKRDIFASIVDRIKQRAHRWTRDTFLELGRWYF